MRTESYLAPKRGRRALSVFPAHALGRPRARLGNPNTGIPEVVVLPQYDIYFVAPGNPFPVVTLFTVQKGGNYTFGGVTAFAKTKCHTNLAQAGMLQSSYSYQIQALSLIVFAQQGTAHPLLHPEDLNNLLMVYNEFTINDKIYFQGIGAWVPGGGGPSFGGLGTLTAPASTFEATNGWPIVSNIYCLPGGQFINPQETFNWLFDPTQSALAAGGTGAPSTLAAAGNPVGVPAAGIGAWGRMDGTLIRVAQ